MRVLGLLPFLNVKPLSYSLENGVLPEGCSLTYAPPAQLARMLRSGDICAAPVSSFACFENPDLLIVPDICIASHGPVTSVLMFSKKRVEQIETIALDSGSLSGASMLRIVLSERYGVTPDFVTCEPDIDLMLQRSDAGLLLGNRAMQTDARLGRDLNVLDLGTEWLALTGLPAVFAVWAVTPGAPLDELIALLRDSKEQGMRHLADIAEKESAKLELPYQVCYDYLADVMIYDMGPNEIEGLRAFAAKAYEHDLVDRAVELRFAGSDSAVGHAS